MTMTTAEWLLLVVYVVFGLGGAAATGWYVPERRWGRAAFAAVITIIGWSAGVAALL